MPSSPTCAGGRWAESVQGPPRRYYALTDAGRAALAAFRGAWPVFRDAVDATLNGAHR